MKGHARQFMTTKVVVATPRMTVAEAARELSRLEVSGLPVVEDDDQVIGIVTESDILTILFEEESVEASIRSVMTTPVVTVDEFTPADTVIRLLRTHRVHHLPVTRQGVVVGLITPQEILRFFVSHELPVPPEVA
jgi:CBS domain-containing protein